MCNNLETSSIKIAAGRAWAQQNLHQHDAHVTRRRQYQWLAPNKEADEQYEAALKLAVKEMTARERAS